MVDHCCVPLMHALCQAYLKKNKQIYPLQFEDCLAKWPRFLIEAQSIEFQILLLLQSHLGLTQTDELAGYSL